jgi:hypothetical protein
MELSYSSIDNSIEGIDEENLNLLLSNLSPENAKHLLGNEDYLFETRVSILATTAACPIWNEVFLRVRKQDMVFFYFQKNKKTKQREVVLLHTITYSSLVNVMLNPDSYELRFETKSILFTYSGWFTIVCKSGIDYDTILEIVQNKSLEYNKHIIFEYKTRQQDKRYGLIDSNEKDFGVFIEQIIHRPYKQGVLQFRVTRLRGNIF